MALIEGCINPIIKRVLLQAIDEGCSSGQNELICKQFRDQLSDLPACGEEKPVATVAPLVIEKKRIQRPYELSDYQKHMSVCLAEREGDSKKYSFDGCREMWNKDKVGLSKKYHGSGMTKTKN